MTKFSSIPLKNNPGGNDTLMGVGADNADFRTPLAGFMPTGAVLPFAGAGAPNGWLLCDGSVVSRTTYANLFAAIGAAFGAGDGATTFALPDMRGRMPVGTGTGTYVAKIAAANINATTDLLTVTNANTRALLQGTPVVATTDGTMPGGLVAGSTYYVIAVDSTHIKLTNTADNIGGAGGPVPLDITSAGTGNLILTMTLTTRNLADVGGEEKHMQTQPEVGNHIHNAGIGPSASNNMTSNGFANSGAGADQPAGNRAIANTANNGYRSGQSAFNVMSPFVALNYIIKS